MIRRLARALVPLPARRAVGRARDWLNAQYERLRIWPRVGFVRFGNLRRVEPLNRAAAEFQPDGIEGYYIAQFFAEQTAPLRGRALLIGRFPLANPSNQLETQRLPADAALAQLPADLFDCVLLPHALSWVWDLRGFLRDCHRVLKPGGVLLATVPGLRQVSPASPAGEREYWRLTTRTAKLLMAETFPQGNVTVTTHGNVLAALALLHGVPAAALDPAELRHVDPMYQLVITIRAIKSPSP